MYRICRNRIREDYDAVVAVHLDGHEYRFTLEYERTPKAERNYQTIWTRFDVETEFRRFLYLVSNHDLLSLLVREFQDCRRPVHFGLRKDFLAETLSLTAPSNRSPVSSTFRAVLTRILFVPVEKAQPLRKLLFLPNDVTLRWDCGES